MSAVIGYGGWSAIAGTLSLGSLVAFYSFVTQLFDPVLHDTGNYRRRVLHKLAKNLELPKVTFQVIRRTIATLAQKKGTVKDVQGFPRHSRAAPTTDVYMQRVRKVCNRRSTRSTLSSE